MGLSTEAAIAADFDLVLPAKRGRRWRECGEAACSRVRATSGIDAAVLQMWRAWPASVVFALPLALV